MPQQLRDKPVHADVTDLDRKMMKRAMTLARQAAAQGEVPVGAVVYRGEEIIAEGFNLREESSDPVAHAELLALSRAGRKLGEWRLNDCTLAVTLEPCPMCAGAMVNARLGRVIYGAKDPKAGACDSLFGIPTDDRLNHRVEVIGGVMAEPCGQLLKDFFRARRKAKKQERAAKSCNCGSTSCEG
ncbi:MAG: tRNA adenosine(34) deaminase TadA [Planctomycetota bacterium]